MHLKISELMERQKQLSSNLESDRIKYASLQNENEYLIKQYSDFKHKEKQHETDIQKR